MANPSSVTLNIGDTVTFSAGVGVSFSVLFSPDAIAAFTPQPSNPVAVAEDNPSMFAYLGSQNGALYAFIAPSGQVFPMLIPPGSTQSVLQISTAPLFPIEASPAPVHDRQE